MHSNEVHRVLCNNKLTGSIPEALGNLVTLVTLCALLFSHSQGQVSNFIDRDLGSNSLSGEVPESIGNMTNLQEL